eukprot:scaffold10603_cov17-Tisochrysis_lutea.AAC.2
MLEHCPWPYGSILTHESSLAPPPITARKRWQYDGNEHGKQRSASSGRTLELDDKTKLWLLFSGDFEEGPAHTTVTGSFDGNMPCCPECVPGHHTCFTSVRMVFIMRSNAPPHEIMPCTRYSCNASVAAPKAGFTSSKACSKSDMVTCAEARTRVCVVWPAQRVNLVVCTTLQSGPHCVRYEMIREL